MNLNHKEIMGGDPSEAAHGISRQRNTVGDKSLQNKAPMSFLFKMNGVLLSLFTWKKVKIIHLCWYVLIFKTAPQN